MTWEKAWLNYRGINKTYKGWALNTISVPAVDCKIVASIKEEMTLAVRAMLGQEVTFVASQEAGIIFELAAGEASEGYSLRAIDQHIHITATTTKGLLYGAFELIRTLQAEKDLEDITIEKTPDNPMRILNHWDNMDGSIERGYSGNSFFFKDSEFILNDRLKDYARLVGSIGINAVVINNVNVKDAATYLITERYFKELKVLLDTFEAYGAKL